MFHLFALSLKFEEGFLHDQCQNSPNKTQPQWLHKPKKPKVNRVNLISQQPDIVQIYLFAKDPYRTKHQFLINKREGTCIKHLNDFKAFIEYSHYMDDIYKNIDKYNPNKKLKILIVFDDMIA